ncbi:hypothetical protein Aple_016980 [Acrocarpospora pleiomorpha]|uniref:Uncharacterized protein n=1 Tax=Acrocarpospora pleiomorpha TaxID=90975 RepID=A0A5M3XIB1_9ACTN|nr:hypothetical protein Aple_016980 [Acrocarpospora pleiomorpha]
MLDQALRIACRPHPSRYGPIHGECGGQRADDRLRTPNRMPLLLVAPGAARTITSVNGAG